MRYDNVQGSFSNAFTTQQLKPQEAETQHEGSEQSKTIHMLVNADLSVSGIFRGKKYFKKLEDYYSNS